MVVLTRRPAPPVEGFTFVTGYADALAAARRLAGPGAVSIGGGADLVRQALRAGDVDELGLSTAPVVLGAGKRLFEGFDRDLDLEVLDVRASPYATHVRYRVVRGGE